MEEHNLIQGSPEWHAFRQKHFGSSEVAAMLGLSPYSTRHDLLREKKYGVKKDTSSMQKVFDKGHQTEALARPIMESILHQDLFATVCSDDDGVISCSCDGLTADPDELIAWEHKQWNAELVAQVKLGIVPDTHMPQCQQILMVTNAQKLYFTVSDGTKDNFVFCTVYPHVEWFKRIRDGWKQFAVDLENFEDVAVVDKPQADAILALPAVVIQVLGKLALCNLDTVTPRFDAFLAGAKTDLQTDDDFANGEATAKFARSTAKTLKLKVKEVIDQTATVSEAIRTLEFYADKFDGLGLKLEKAVKEQKDIIRRDLINTSTAAFNAHIVELEADIKPIRLVLNSADQPDFVACIKNLRTITSLHNAVATALANGKIAANNIASDIAYKLDFCKRRAAGYHFLFQDLQTVIYKPLDDFTNLVESRITRYEFEKAAEAEKERARIQAEEEAKARAKIEAEERSAIAARVKAELEEQAKVRAIADRIRAESQAEAEKLVIAMGESQKASMLAETASRLNSREAVSASVDILAEQERKARQVEAASTVEDLFSKPVPLAVLPFAPACPSWEEIVRLVARTYGVTNAVALGWLVETSFLDREVEL